MEINKLKQLITEKIEKENSISQLCFHTSGGEFEESGIYERWDNKGNRKERVWKNQGDPVPDGEDMWTGPMPG